MKTKYFGAVAIAVVAFILCSYTININIDNKEKFQTIVYLVYNSGSQSAIGSYTQTTVMPSCPGAVKLCAIRIIDTNGVVTQAEFTPAYNVLDTDLDGTLDDETETATLLKKA